MEVLVEVNGQLEHGLIAIEAAIATSEAASHNEHLPEQTDWIACGARALRQTGGKPRGGGRLHVS